MEREKGIKVEKWTWNERRSEGSVGGQALVEGKERWNEGRSVTLEELERSFILVLFYRGVVCSDS